MIKSMTDMIFSFPCQLDISNLANDLPLFTEQKRKQLMKWAFAAACSCVQQQEKAKKNGNLYHQCIIFTIKLTDFSVRAP